MSAKGTRPAVVSDATYRRLDEYRGFRHLVRNVYTFNLRPSRVEELVQDLRPCYASLARDMEAFSALLIAMNEEPDP